jgi:D-arabinose 1-dehydrogenase-like Zn-dependent alcohol dehydrogenase
MASLICVGYWIGRSEIFAPFRSRSTYLAAPAWSSNIVGPYDISAPACTSKYHGASFLTLPAPQADEVLIDVHAASVSYMDYLMICGGYQMRPALPYVPGKDAVGIVVGCGGNVERFRPGSSCLRGVVRWFCRAHDRQSLKHRTSSEQRRLHYTVYQPA